MGNSFGEFALFYMRKPETGTFLDKISQPMLILLPSILLAATAFTLVILRLIRPAFRFIWLVAASGSILTLATVLLWQIHLPQFVALPAWHLQPLFYYSPSWLADRASWPYVLSLVALALAIILTSVARAEANPMAWVGTLLLTALGLLAVTAENPLALVLAWTALDLTELVTMLLSVEGEKQSEGVVVAFAARLAGTGLLIWANILSIAGQTPLNLIMVPARSGLYLLLAVGLRLGVLPLHLAYRKERMVRRGFGTALRLVTAASSLVLLARLPAGTIPSSIVPYLLALTCLAAFYAGWMWLFSSDELTGRSFWLVGMAALSFAAAIRGNPTGSIAWGIGLILGGGCLFLYSARQRRLLWLPVLSLMSLTALPFTITATGWLSGENTPLLYWLPFLMAQSLLLAGFIRHSLNVGETSLESTLPWVKVIYPLGLFLLLFTQLILSLWGWAGARQIGVWWAALADLGLVALITWLALKYRTQLPAQAERSHWSDLFRLNWLYRAAWILYRWLGRMINVITSTSEGDGGVLWSFVILALFLSLLARVSSP